jgi:glycosyltransferase involved in cell wall biosynthesis
MPRLLLISDSDRAATGFGTAVRNIAPRLCADGFVVDALAIYDYHGSIRTADCVTSFPVDPSDSMGFGRIPMLVERRPGVVLLMHELLHCGEWARRLRSSGWTGPIVGFFPVYGPVFSPLERRALHLLDVRAALSEYGARVVGATGLPCAAIPLGVDADVFRPASAAARRTLRRRFGWDSRFVVAYVARNRWNKQQPKLLGATRILRDGGMPEVLLYLHCVPTPGRPHWVPGMGAVAQEYDLLSLRSDLGLDDMVRFPDDLAEQHVGIPTRLLVQRLQAADCAVHAAHGEGFGLPLLEAMACGLPVAFTADERVMSEVVGAAGLGVTPCSDLVDHAGNRFGDVSPAQWAAAILALRDLLRHPRSRAAARRRARRRCMRFGWDSTASALSRMVREAMDRGENWRIG